MKRNIKLLAPPAARRPARRIPARSGWALELPDFFIKLAGPERLKHLPVEAGIHIHHRAD